jgi:ATP-dependent Lhr-like helicase
MAGEQYALPEAASLLSDVRRDAGQGAEVEVAGADPLNLTGALLGGDRIPAVRHRTVRYRNGVPAEPPLPVGVADPR